MAKFTREEVEDIVSKLVGADLSRAYLWGANLSAANLSVADLRLATLTGADLYAANLIGANLSRAKLDGANYNAETKWPEGFDPEAEGAVLVLVEDKTALETS
jgi:uncharacterized protein YjbI with pentapeptide repeats